MADYYFKMDDMAVGYQGKTLIHDINIGIDKGEIVTLIGPNGSGKSTILKSITKQLKLIGGKVFFDDTSLQEMSYKELSSNMAVVLTERIKTELMTCHEIVATGRYPYTGRLGILTPEDEQIVDEAMKAVHAEDLGNRDFNAISDGQKQRVLLARKKHITVIMSLHEIDLAQKVSDKIICVKGDTIAHYGKPEEVFKEDTIRSLYEIDNGSFDPVFGSIELPKIEGEPEVFVISSGGSGIPIYRQLQKEHIPFAAGILYKNDIDYQLARLLAVEVITEEPFRQISDETFARAVEVMKKCKRVIVTDVPVGECNKRIEELIKLAK